MSELHGRLESAPNGGCGGMVAVSAAPVVRGVAGRVSRGRGALEGGGAASTWIVRL
ncbi:hypothetical protein GCM10022227_37280 [Streptomyces sedi]